ncbi:MAG: hypothetical protein ACYS8K_07295, partial [Planctomycetota bacterium]
YRVGVLGLLHGPGPGVRDAVSCPKLLHLGWVGVELNCRFVELADFLLGWAGVDFMEDDVAE